MLSAYVSQFRDEGTLVRRYFPEITLAEDDTVLTGGRAAGFEIGHLNPAGCSQHVAVEVRQRLDCEMRAFARRVVDADLTTEDQLAALREELPEMNLPVTPGELANILQDRGIVTDYQVAVLLAACPDSCCAA